MLVQLEVSGPKLGFSSVIKIDAGFSTDNSQSDGYEEIDIPAKVDIEKHKAQAVKSREQFGSPPKTHAHSRTRTHAHTHAHTHTHAHASPAAATPPHDHAATTTHHRSQ